MMNTKSKITFNIDENIRKYNGVFEFPRALNIEVEILYKNRGSNPTKYIFKYKSASYRISEGVFIKISILFENTTPMIVNINPKNVIDNKDVEMLILMSIIFFAPKNCEITIELPMLSPVAIATNKKLMDEEAPTAARAFAPTKFPTIIESITLYSC